MSVDRKTSTGSLVRQVSMVSITPAVACTDHRKISTSSLSSCRSLGSHQISVTEDYHLSSAAKVVRISVAMAAYFGVSACVGIIGPALLDLQLLTHTTTSEISLIFLVRGAMALVSCAVMGPVLDKLNHYLVVGVCMVVLAVFTGVVPWSSDLATILVTLGPPEFCCSAVAMSTQLMGLELWHDNSGPVLQALNFFGIAGFMVAPLLVQPFISAHENEAGGVNSSHVTSHVTRAEERYRTTIGLLTPGLSSGQGNFSERMESTTLSDVIMDSTSSVVTMADDVVSNVLAINNASLTVASEDFRETTIFTTREEDTDTHDTDIKFAFWLAALWCLFVGVFSLAVFYASRCKQPTTVHVSVNDEEGEEEEHALVQESSTKLIVTIGVLVFIFNVFYAGIEIGYAGLLVKFAVEHLSWSKETGTWLLTLLQGSNCLITAVCIPVSRFVRPSVLLALDLVVLNAALVVEALLVEQHDAVMWVCTAGVGIGYGILAPCTLTWLDTIMEVNGKFSSVYWAGYFAGFTAMPTLSGFLFKEVDRMCFVYVNLGSSVMATVLFVFLCFVVHTQSPKKTEDTHL